MRGKDEQQLDVFSYISPEQRVPQDHPLRPLRVMTDEALRELEPQFHKRKQDGRRLRRRSCCGRSRVQRLQQVGSERLLMEQPDYNLLLRWLVVFIMDE